MDLKLDLTKEYGLVLEGGGAKGAYQIGAWKALKELGVAIRGVAGVSVGALNGALICMDDLERAEKVWENISYSAVLEVDDELAKKVRKGGIKLSDIPTMVGSLGKILKEGGFDIAPLKKLIAENIDGDMLLNAGRELFVTTYSVSDRKLICEEVASQGEDRVRELLLASAYLPVFKTELLEGKRYMDAGGINNVPIDVLTERGYRDIIVIRIYGLGYDSEKKLQLPEGVNLLHIAPRVGLGGILEFDSRKARRNMTMGYYDAMRMAYGLAGRLYYLDAPDSEDVYFEAMMSDRELIAYYLREKGMIGGDRICRYRTLTEGLFPKLATEFHLRDDWDYKDLYLAMLEGLAGKFSIDRFAVYTPEELAVNVSWKLEEG